MIQVCSACGTRWNVRDRQRAWCPRCQGALLAPAPAPPRPAAPNPPRPGGAPAGFRWIAVRPGPPPAARRRRSALSPTPRYPANPGWGLHDTIDPVPEPTAPPAGPSTSLVTSALRITAIVLAVAAAAHALRYVLLLINRATLLHPVIAGFGVWLGVLASFAALVAVIWCAVVLTRWLIARRTAAYGHRRLEDPRPAWMLWAGCLIPVANLLWAPVFVIETAMFEGIYSRLRRPIIIWWILWVLSTLLSAFAIGTSFATDAQGIADNTVRTTLAYLLALATVVALTRVHEGFERKPVDRSAHRWVVVPTEPAAAPDPEPEPEPESVGAEPDVAVETRDREPAA